MTHPIGTLLLLALSQNPTPTPEQDAARAAQAAERAAQAAERAAQAAERAATAVAAQNAVRAPAAEAKAAADAAAPRWSGVLGFGLISLTGNAESLTFTGNGAFERKSEKWVLGVKAAGAYGQTRPAEGGDPTVVALNAGVQGRADRKVTTVASVYALVGADTDHVKSVELRGYGEGGAGVVWHERKEADFTRALVRTDLALRYAYESRFNYYPTPAEVDDLDLLAPRLGVALQYGLSKNVQLREDAEVLYNVAGAARVLVNSTTKLSARLTESLSLGVSFLVAHDSAPAPGKRATDTALNIGLEVAL